jgi:alpha(1,3/1,4) fucosyltransferase
VQTGADRFTAIMKRTVRIDFSDFWTPFDKRDNFFFKLLSERFDVQLCDQPDFLIYANGGHVHRLHNCIKIFYTHESILPNFQECDYAFTSFCLDDPRHLRLPYYVVLHESPESIIKSPAEIDRLLASKTKFCSFIVSQHHRRKNQNRLSLFTKLSEYKRVDSGGRFMNNIGGPVTGGYEGKVAWLKDYKFNIAFENAAVEGYTTEKIFQAMMARCLPIYWGNPRIHEEFNPRSFLNAAEFPNEKALVERIIELDRDDRQYREYLAQPCFIQNQPSVWFDRQRLLDQFERIVNDPGPSISVRRRRKKFFSFGRWILVKRYHLGSVQK